MGNPMLEVPLFLVWMALLSLAFIDVFHWHPNGSFLLIDLNYLYFLKYGATRLEVNVDGSVSFPEPQFDPKDGGKYSTSLLPFLIWSCFINF